MAVRYNSNGENLRNDNIATRLNYNDCYTMMVWYYPVAHPATVNLGFLWMSNTGITAYDVIGQESTYNGAKMYVGDTVSGFDYSAAAVATSTWHHVAMVRYSSELLRGFLNSVQFGTDRTGNVGGRVAASKTWIGNTSSRYYISARFAHAKLWNVPLSPEEIQAEMWSNAPVTNLSNVVVWSPLMAENRSADYGQFGFNWTENGPLSDEAGPEILLRAAARVGKVQRWWIPSVSSGGIIPLIMHHRKQQDMS
jgi:hypothetical protein